MSYDIRSFGMMIEDSVRVGAYAAALQKAVKPGSVVIDIGAGTGVLTLLACRFGAARVYAIDPNPLVALVEDAALLNGFSDRVVVVHDLSTNFTPESRADVIVSDLRGVLPIWEGHFEAVTDARKRLLAPGGTLIPTSDSVYAAVVTAAAKYTEITAPWDSRSYGVDLSSGRESMLNTWSKYRFGPDQLMTRAQLVRFLDYRAVSEADTRFSAETEMVVESDGVGHGLGLWFDTDLHEGIGFSNAPGEPEALYGRGFFPWLEPVALRQGYRVLARVQAWPVAGPHIWCWQTTVFDAAGGSVAEFSQSTFNAAPRDRQQLDRSAGSYTPHRSRDMEMDSFVLAQIDGRTDLREISRRLHAVYSAELPDEHGALDYVARCSRRYP